MSSNVAFSEGAAQLFLDNCKPYLAHLKNSFKQKIMTNKEHLEAASANVVDRMIDEIVLESVADFHRAVKLDQTEILFGHLLEDSASSKSSSIISDSDKDKKIEDINCPNCQKLIHASRFACHLEKCMVQGRSSSRIASQRRANNSKECSYTGDDDDEDDFWKLNKSKNMKKVDGKKKKDNVRRAKPYKVESPKGAKDGGNSSSNSLKEEVQSPGKLSRESSSSSLAGKDGNGENDSWISPNKVTPLLGEDKAAQLMAVRCGVKSDHTGKFCGRSLRCPLHTDAERADARKNLVSDPSSNWESVVEVEEETNKTELGNFSSLINITSPSTPRKKDKKKVGFPKIF